ncbi:5-oxoprolinase subunit PxpA [Mariniflexile ostreae]|uniref:5-oxoprolinase subunit PxpA n=1 Tax=Mariniflexile ostreae TaxID=1520892 RepID=A0ABV5FAS2_9FLAO
MKKYRIDINVDVGEGIGNEHQLMPYVSSCNIACGGHSGDEKTMRAVIKFAKAHGVKIGAHPSFPDKENFGRQAMDMSCVSLFTSLKNQIKDLLAVLKEEHAVLHHIKPHGALYNKAAVDKRTAVVLVEVVKSLRMPVKLFVPYGSVIEKVALNNGLDITYEGFADRNYNSDLTLVSRKEDEALICDGEKVFEHVYRMLATGKLKTINGDEIDIKAETFCVHGDTPNAVLVLQHLYTRLQEKGIQIH